MAKSSDKRKDRVRTAPHPFFDKYGKLRESLESLSRNKVMDDQADYIGNLFAAAMKTFPKKEFGHIAGEKEKFEAVFGAGLRNNASPKDLFDLAELFWFFFCYHLRLNRKCHENVPKETLNIWAEEIPWETLGIEHALQNHAELFRRGPADDPLILSLLEDREKRMKRIDDFMSKYPFDDDTGAYQGHVARQEQCAHSGRAHGRN